MTALDNTVHTEMRYMAEKIDVVHPTGGCAFTAERLECGEAVIYTIALVVKNGRAIA